MEYPDKVSWRVVDAWLAQPPCEPWRENPFCHVQCPYFNECNPPEDYEDEEWPEDDEEM